MARQIRIITPPEVSATTALRMVQSFISRDADRHTPDDFAEYGLQVRSCGGSVIYKIIKKK